MKKWLLVGLHVLVLFCLCSFDLLAQSTDSYIAGRLLDAKTDEPLVGGTVLIVGTTMGAAADIDGKFTIKVPPGTYALEGRSIGYKSKRVEGIVVQARETQLVTLALQSSDLQVDEVEIVVNLAKNNESNLLQDQRAATGINSGVSAELLSKTPDRSLAESFKRISGASVREGKFAVVRGLQERYNQGQVNGMVQPSTEADRKAFSLDLFPTALVDRITVYKTGTPDLPGDFVGGIINITTLDIPFSNVTSLSIAGESQRFTTGKPFSRGITSPTDALGFDDGRRAIPVNFFSRAEAEQQYGYQEKAYQSRFFHNNFNPTKTGIVAPNMSLQFFLGRRAKIWGRTAGFMLGATWSRTFLNQQYTTNSYTEVKDSTGLKRIQLGESKNNQYRSAGALNLVANFSIRPTVASKLSFRNLFVAKGLAQFQQGTGYTKSDPEDLPTKGKSSGDYYEENRLGSHQLNYELNLGTSGAKIEALAGMGYLLRNTPDNRRLFYSDQNGGVANAPVFYVAQIATTVTKNYNPSYAGNFFSNLTETNYNGTASYTQPFKVLGLKNEFKTGGAFSWRSRSYTGRNFLYEFPGSIIKLSPKGGKVNTLGPDSIFSDAYLGGNLVALRETTVPSDFYKAFARLNAGFAMLQTNFGANSKVIYGVRLEQYTQVLNSFIQGGAPLNETRIWNDILPSINTQLGITKDFYLRLAYFRSVNRPEFREVSPANFYDPLRNVIILGKPELVEARVHNLDAKLEWYPSSGSVLSFNAYYKKIDRPIEQTISLDGGAFPTFTYANNNNGVVQGIELEGRSTLGFLAKNNSRLNNFLDGIAPFANISLQRSVLTKANYNDFKRPLQGQAPYILNLGLQVAPANSPWQGTATLNRMGTRLAFAADDYISGYWERPRTVIDASVQYAYKRWTFKGTVGDLLAQNLILYSLGGSQVDPKNPKSRRDFLQAPVYKPGVDLPVFITRYGQTYRLTINYQW